MDTANPLSRLFIMTGHQEAGVSKAMNVELVAGLRHLGADASLLDIDAAPGVFAELGYRGFCLIDGNHKIHLPVPIPKFSIMVDHPCMRIDDVATGHPPSEILGWVDESHPEAAAALSLPYRSMFLPHAGPDLVADPLPMAERDIDVFFAASLAEGTTREGWRAGRPDLPALLVDLLFDTVERIETRFEPAIPALLASCAERGVAVNEAFDRAQFCGIVSKAIEIAEMNRRVNVLLSLPELRVCIAASRLPAGLQGRPNVSHTGFIHDFAEIRRLMGRSKIVLNVTAKFPRGSHERIWFGMAEGAAILTEKTVMLNPDFQHGESILYLPQHRLQPGDLDFLAGLLQQPARLQQMAERAGERYRDAHTWKQRAEPLWQALKAVAVSL